MESSPAKYVEREDGRYYEERLIITDDVDFNAKWKLQSILAWMQEIAESHSRVYDYGFEDLRAKNACWVCLRYHLKFESYPRIYDKVQTYTWAEPARLGVYPRMFSLEDGSGTAKIRAASMWSIIDLDERAMVNPVKLGLPPYPTRKIQNFADLKPLSKIVIPDGEEIHYKYKPLYSDFDMNGHVNNTSYLLWFVNCFSLEEHRKYEVRELLIHYNQEVRPDIELDLRFIRSKDQVYFSADSEAGNHFQMLAALA
ncbi:MAG: thioesterase [Eubacteriales bacterium]|nr:thioesterase [Eubacteriales bacterium]MDD4323884.1 thioesterase [Eubacteriales bacterium]MDD4540768.1 thioesterase [Eubacteriales bacterium]